jgi:hypothetical protein
MYKSPGLRFGAFHLAPGYRSGSTYFILTGKLPCFALACISNDSITIP